MDIFCPFCKQEYELEEQYLGEELECGACARDFRCTLAVTPVVGSMYVGIKTTARPSVRNARISTIVWWCDGRWQSLVNGKDDPSLFRLFWRHAPEVVTYNGKSFGEPKICSQLDLPIHPNHTDLRTPAEACGLTGGLETIGQQIAAPRPDGPAEVDGATAIKLWNKYQTDNSVGALQTLLYYNAWDVVLTYRLHCHVKGTAAEPIHETIPFEPDPESLEGVLAKPRPGGKRLPGGKMEQLWAERKLNPLQTLRGAEVCFTGDLEHSDRDDLLALVNDLGGITKLSAARTLDFLVVGDTGHLGRTAKLCHAESNIAKGAHTRIIDEKEFWRLVKATRDG